MAGIWGPIWGDIWGGIWESAVEPAPTQPGAMSPLQARRRVRRMLIDAPVVIAPAQDPEDEDWLLAIGAL